MIGGVVVGRLIELAIGQAAAMIGFLAYVVPAGQMSFWLSYTIYGE